MPDLDNTLVAGPPQQHLNIEDLGQVCLQIAADLGQSLMFVRDILELKRGSIIQLDKLAGEMSDIYINGLPLARGEVVVIGDTLHVRIGEIIGTEDKAEETEEEEDEDEDY